jgi:hypothetical protein
MKKTVIILGTAFLFLAATAKAQTDTMPAKSQTESTVNKDAAVNPAQNSTAMVTDRWNNWSPDKYKMLPMPAPLTTEKIFPVIGQYTVTSTEEAGAAPMNVSITLDESSKGIAWIEGLPQGKLKAYLQKSPATYMIPVQKGADEKEISAGVLIYDKDNNKLDVCIGCKFNAEDPVSSFTAPAEPVAQEQPVVVKKSKSKKSASVKKVAPVVKSTWKYSGSKNAETTATVKTGN